MKAFFLMLGWILASKYFWKRVLIAICNVLTMLSMWLWFLPYLVLYMGFLQPEYGKKIILGQEFILDDLLIGYYLDGGVICFILNWLILTTMPLVAPLYFLIDMIQQRNSGSFYNFITGKEYVLDM